MDSGEGLMPRLLGFDAWSVSRGCLSAVADEGCVLENPLLEILAGFLAEILAGFLVDLPDGCLGILLLLHVSADMYRGGFPR